MKKHFSTLVCAVAMALVSLPVYAQMTDDAVISYAKSGLAAGKSQQDIARELAARGVTMEQAERLKSRMEEHQANKNEAVRVAGVQENERRLNGINLADDASMDLVTSEIAQPEKLSAEEDAKVVFGRNIFTNRNLTFTPSMNIPTPTNYKLGPGDEVIIEIWGTNQATIRSTISAEGTINVQDIGLVNLNGMTVKEADAYMRKMLGRIYSVDGENDIEPIYQDIVLINNKFLFKDDLKNLEDVIFKILINKLSKKLQGATHKTNTFNELNSLKAILALTENLSLDNTDLINQQNVLDILDIVKFVLDSELVNLSLKILLKFSLIL